MFNSRSKKTDENLVHLIQSGDEQALTELYQRYSYKLLRYFHNMLWKDEALAQDFLHDLFVKVIENPGRIDASRRFATWVYSVAHNMCKNEYRRRNVREQVNGHAVSEPLAPAIDSLLDGVLLELELEKILGADEDDRSLFLLRYELDFPIDDIASILGLPSGTVKSRLFNLKRKLARKLSHYNPALK